MIYKKLFNAVFDESIGRIFSLLNLILFKKIVSITEVEKNIEPNERCLVSNYRTN
jgi:hypothetical protein